MKLADAFKSCEIAKKYMDANIAVGIDFALKIFGQVEPDVLPEPPTPETKEVPVKKRTSPKVYVCAKCGKEFKGVGRQKECADCRMKTQREEEIRRVASDLARAD